MVAGSTMVIDAQTITIGHSTITATTMALRAGFLTIDANVTQLGIGVLAPFNLLHVRKTAVTGGDANADDIVVLENTGQANLNIISTTAGQILFSDDVRARGYVSYNHSTDGLGFGTAGATTLTISSAGAVAIPYVWATALRVRR